MSDGPGYIDQTDHFKQEADYWREDFWNMFARKEALEASLKVLAEKELPADVQAVVTRALAESEQLATVQAEVCIMRGKQAKGNEPAAKGGPGEVVLAKALRPDGTTSLAFQLINTDGAPLAFLDLTRREAEHLIRQLRGAVASIWGFNA